MVLQLTNDTTTDDDSDNGEIVCLDDDDDDSEDVCLDDDDDDI